MILPPRRAAAPAALPLLLLAACSAPERSDFQGYVEGEYLYLAAPQAGYLKSLDAPRGHRVAGGDRLFEIAADPDDQALAEAQARAGAAREKLENLREPRRTPEIAALEAQLAGTIATRRLAEAQFQRQQTLLRQQFVSASALDDARARRDQAVASEDAARQQLATARITLGRAPELRGAPELRTGARATPASDLFSAGVVLLELAFAPQPLPDALDRIDADLDACTLVPDSLPVAWQATLRSLLSPDPEARSW